MTATVTKRRGRATIEDVAAEAGVSVATVSRALRGLPNVAAATRERVNTVAASLDYEADPAASRLAAGRTRTVVVAVPTLSGWYFSTVVAGAEAVCAEAGYDFSVVAISTEDDRHRLLSDRHHLERKADGLILVELPLADDEAERLRERGMVVTTIGTSAAGSSSVRIDDDAVGRLAAAHLTSLGHRRLGLIGGTPLEPMSCDVTGARRRGFASQVRTAGLAFDESMFETGNFDIDGGQAAMAALLARPNPPTAVFAMSDEMAFGALMVLQMHGLQAGADVSVMGVDDHEFARVIGLTTIRQSVADHGATAARALVASMNDTERQPACVGAAIELVVRTTTTRPLGVAARPEDHAN